MAKLVLPIKEGFGKERKVVKTYECESITLTTGLVQDLMAEIDPDTITGTNLDEQKLGTVFLKMFMRNFPKFFEYCATVFPGLTEEEFRATDAEDVVKILIEVLKFGIETLYGTIQTTKNQMGAQGNH